MGIAERKEREKAEKREHLINAAEKVIFAKGYENATMDEIAEEAEYSRGALYLYFKNKEQIYLAIANRSIDIFLKILLDELAKGKNAAEKLQKLKDAYLRFFLEDPDHMKAMIMAMSSKSVVDHLNEDDITLKEMNEKDLKVQQIIGAAVMEGWQKGELEHLKDIDLQELLFGGKLILLGIYTSVFSIEELYKDHVHMEPEKIIQVLYSLLKF